MLLSKPFYTFLHKHVHLLVLMNGGLLLPIRIAVLPPLHTARGNWPSTTEISCDLEIERKMLREATINQNIVLLVKLFPCGVSRGPLGTTPTYATLQKYREVYFFNWFILAKIKSNSQSNAGLSLKDVPLRTVLLSLLFFVCSNDVLMFFQTVFVLGYMLVSCFP